MGYVYVDSGSLYRGVTWKTIREGVPASDPLAVAELLGRIGVEACVLEGAVRFSIDGEDPGEALRSEAVVERVSDVAAIPAVRQFVVDRLRETTRYGNLVMEGRDIGSVVFPDSRWKFYLDADPEERARRRHREQAGEVANEDEANDELAGVRDSLQRRDRKDATRTANPLQVASGAHVINTTTMSIEEVSQSIVDQMLGICTTH